MEFDIFMGYLSTDDWGIVGYKNLEFMNEVYIYWVKYIFKLI